MKCYTFLAGKFLDLAETLIAKKNIQTYSTFGVFEALEILNYWQNNFGFFSVSGYSKQVVIPSAPLSLFW